ncbi:hypothetical protein V8E53_006228 [Lactarius tabidus]
MKHLQRSNLEIEVMSESDSFSTDDEDEEMDMAHTKVAMLSEKLHSIELLDPQTSVPSPSDCSIGTSNREKSGDPLCTPTWLLPQIDSITQLATTSSNRIRWQCSACWQHNFARVQERDRHILTHLPHWIHCPFPDCFWTGYRTYVFRVHHLEHGRLSHGPYPCPEREAFEIYDPRTLVNQIGAGTVTIDDAAAAALELVRVKAFQLRKPSLLVNQMPNKLRADSSSEGLLPVTGSEPNKPNMTEHDQDDQMMHVERHLVSDDGSAHSTSASWAAWAEEESWVEPAYRMQDQVNEE